MLPPCSRRALIHGVQLCVQSPEVEGRTTIRSNSELREGNLARVRPSEIIKHLILELPPNNTHQTLSHLHGPRLRSPLQRR